MKSAVLLRIMLVWALMIQPLGMLAHAWSHLADQDIEQPADHGNLHDSACELCVAYAQTAAALPSAGASCTAASAIPCPPLAACPELAGSPPALYQPRAPPSSV
ncbi:MAG: hypothetical protein ABR553_10465 [Gammaproteobacteria bacterium]